MCSCVVPRVMGKHSGFSSSFFPRFVAFVVKPALCSPSPRRVLSGVMLSPIASTANPPTGLNASDFMSLAAAYLGDEGQDQRDHRFLRDHACLPGASPR